MASNTNYDICSPLQCNVCLVDQVDAEKVPEQQKSNGTPVKSRPKLRQCTGCCLVMYCNESHQKIDWELHQTFCRAVQNIKSFKKIAHPFLINNKADAVDKKEQFMLNTLYVKFLLRAALGRSLAFHEEELTSFPAHCAICFSLENLKPCQRCYGVSYCSEAHSRSDFKNHKLNCGYLKLYYCPYKVKPISKDIITSFHARVNSLKTTDLMDAFKQFTHRSIPKDPTCSLESYQFFATVADFSCIATICYTLEFTLMREFDKSKFIIFIIGATVEPDLWFRDMHTKLFFLQFPQIIELDLYFIGPEVESNGNRKAEYLFKNKNRTVNYKCCRCLFQEFVSKQIVHPSIIVIFNCGFSEYAHLNKNLNVRNKLTVDVTKTKTDTWSNGIKEILQTHDVPIVFTSFTSLEADFDYGVLLRIAQTDRIPIRVERIFKAQQNPYRDLRPLRNWQFNDTEEIYFRNGYIQAVRTKLEL